MPRVPTAIDRHINGMRDAIVEYAKKHNIQASMPRVTYDPLSGGFYGKVIVNVTSDPEERQKKEFESAISRNPFGHLKKEHYQKMIDVGDNTYTIIGYKPRNRKYPLIVLTEDGRRVKMNISPYIQSQL